MRGKRAKQLRKIANAHAVLNSVLRPTQSGPVRYPFHSARAIYQRLKKNYSRRNSQ